MCGQSWAALTKYSTIRNALRFYLVNSPSRLTLTDRGTMTNLDMRLELTFMMADL
jgi:hypothetical protein